MSEFLLKKALEAHQSGDLKQAEKFYTAVLKDLPDHPDALALFGLLLDATDRKSEALRSIERAIAMDPNAALFRFYLGNVRMSMGNLAGAIKAYREAITLQADRPEFFYNLGNALRQSGSLEEARLSYMQTLALVPEHAMARNNLALVYEKEKKLADAVRELRQAVEDAPDYAEGWLNLCSLAEKDGQFDLSLLAGQKVTELAPEATDGWFGVGVALNRLARDEEALIAYRKALQLEPERADLWDNLGQTYQCLGRNEESRKAYLKSVEVAGQFIADEDTRKVDESEYGNRHWHLALIELLLGDYRRGFARYRARFHDVKGLQRPKIAAKVWHGEEVRDCTILVMDEQGHGDGLMMARYCPLLRARGAYVKFQLHPALAPYFKGWSGADEILTHDQPIGSCDYYASIFDLPYGFRTALGSIPCQVPYLPLPEPDRDTTVLGERGLKIGVVWAGAPLHKQDSKRSIPLSVFSHLFEESSFCFYSFNRDKREGDEEILAHYNVRDLSGKLYTFLQTAQLMRQMDLIITCDTSTAHLAGGMGLPVWTLLPFAPDWRWLMDREDTAWYPTMRLFRQKKPRAWAPLMAHVREALRKIEN
ncbi:MAG: tetratricopeptide repeat protein [Proteobacteria bacterium]|jgi:tetratricopeptide (TPR) repeat protein|nr:tetratricopeptide repeat protein [Alphaproteobacteria bacterium]NCC02754.1 tetratricopeptide repeat protein [Pseudomonadota bacterium]